MQTHHHAGHRSALDLQCVEGLARRGPAEPRAGSAARVPLAGGGRPAGPRPGCNRKVARRAARRPGAANGRNASWPRGRIAGTESMPSTGRLDDGVSCSWLGHWATSRRCRPRRPSPCPRTWSHCSCRYHLPHHHVRPATSAPRAGGRVHHRPRRGRGEHHRPPRRLFRRPVHDPRQHHPAVHDRQTQRHHGLAGRHRHAANRWADRADPVGDLHGLHRHHRRPGSRARRHCHRRPVGLRFAARYQRSQLLIGIIVVQGAFSQQLLAHRDLQWDRQPHHRPPRPARPPAGAPPVDVQLRHRAPRGHLRRVRAGRALVGRKRCVLGSEAVEDVTTRNASTPVPAHSLVGPRVTSSTRSS